MSTILIKRGKSAGLPTLNYGELAWANDTSALYIGTPTGNVAITTGAGDSTYLRLDATNDPVTAGLEVNAATTNEPVLILQTTDDNTTNPGLVVQDSGGNAQITLGVNGAVVINEEGNDADFRVEGSGQANALFVQGSDGYVGIGTGTPAQPLDIVQGTSTVCARFWRNDSAGNTTFEFGHDTSYTKLWTFGHVNAAFRIVNEGLSSTPLYLKATLDRIGLHTVAPVAALHVATTFDQPVTIVTANATQTSLLSVWEDSGGNDQITFSGDGAAVFNEEGNDADFRIEGDTDANLLFVDAGNDRIGIGTNSPNQQLEITGNLRLPASTATTGIVYSAGNTLLHTFGNRFSVFAGVDAGNLTNTGQDNAGFGYYVFNALTSGSKNAALGMQALSKLTEGSQNMGIGVNALRELTTGSNNVAIGQTALSAVVSGSDNVAVGTNALSAYVGTGVHQNVAVGKSTADAITTGYYNTAIGANAGGTNTTGHSNTWLGWSADSASNNLSYAVAIGRGASVAASNTMVLGGVSASTSVSVAIGATSAGARLNVVGDTDEIQLAIKGHSTQTSNQVVFENSAGTDLAAMSGIGHWGYRTATNANYLQAAVMAGDDSATQSLYNGVQTVTLGANQVYNQYGYDATLTIANGAYRGNKTNAAFRFVAQISGSEATAANKVIGVYGSARNTGTGKVYLYDFYSDTVVNSGGGNIWDSYGYYIADKGHASANNSYGIYIAAQTACVVQNYAIVTNSGNIVFNEGGDANTDFRVEGDTDANLLYVDGGNDAVTIGSTTELGKLGIDGNADEVQFVVQKHSSQTANIMEIQHSNGAAHLVIDSIGQYGFGKAPTAPVDIYKNVTSGSGEIYAALYEMRGSQTTSQSYQLEGFQCKARNLGSGNITGNVTGLVTFGSHGGSGDLATLRGASFQYSVTAAASGTITTATTLDVNTANVDGGTSATITTAHGLLVNDQGSGATTTSYGILIQNQTSSANIFALVTNAGNIVFNEGGDANTDIRFESDTDANMFYLDSGNNAVTFGSTTELGKVGIDGNADEVQFVVQGHSTQTSNIFEIQNSAGSDLASIDNNGHLGLAGTAADSSSVIISSKTFNSASTVYSYNLSVQNQGAGTVYGAAIEGNSSSSGGADSYGVYGIGRASGSSSPSIVRGLASQIRMNSSGTVGTAYCLDIQNMSKTAGTVNTLVGINIGALSGSGNNPIAINCLQGNVIFNENGDANSDFRIESDTDVYMFYLNGGNNAVTFGSATELGKVGIDGNADEVQFVVQGHSTQTSNLQEWQNSAGTVVAGVGGSSTDGRIGVGIAPATDTMLRVSKTFNDTAAVTRYGYYSTIIIDTSSASSATLYGAYTEARSSGSHNVTAVYGSHFEGTHLSSGTVTAMSAVRAKIRYGSAANLTASTPVMEVLVDHTGGGTISNLFGISVTNPTGGGPITTYTGLLINPLSAATNNNAILTYAGNVVFNEGGDAGTDFRVEGDTDANLLTTDASTDSVSVGVAPASHVGKLHVDQSSATGAKPVLTLDQADVDEDYLKIIGTSDTNVDRALVDAADFTTPGAIVGWLKINVQDDQATNPIVDGDYYIPFYAAPTA